MQRFLHITVAGMLFLAVGNMPDPYYFFLRWTVSAIAIYTVFLANKAKLPAWIGAFVVIAIIFNPLAPFYLAKQTWVFIDLVSAAALLIFTFTPTFAQNEKHNG